MADPLSVSLCSLQDMAAAMEALEALGSAMAPAVSIQDMRRSSLEEQIYKRARRGVVPRR